MDSTRGSHGPIHLVAMLTIGTNLARMIAGRSIRQSSHDVAQSLERLATGKQINRASDDPAGMIAVNEFASQQSKLNKKIERLELEDKRYGAMDGAQSVISDLLVELQGTVVQAANTGGTSAGERQGMQIEAESIVKTINHLADTTIYNGDHILSHQRAENMGVVYRDEKQPDGTTKSVRYSLVDLGKGKLNLGDEKSDHELAQQIVDAAASGITTQRAAIGRNMKELQVDIHQAMTEMENVTAARSQIEDTDYAAETSKLVRAQVLQQAGIFTAQLAEHMNSDAALRLLSAIQPIK